MIDLAIGLVVVMIGGIFYFRPKKTNKSEPLISTRTELVDYILNKSLDSYEASLSKELEKASTHELQKIATQMSAVGQTRQHNV